MSTGRRLAKRSIIGTKVCAPGPDGLWYSGVIQDVKSPNSASTNTTIQSDTPTDCHTLGDGQLCADTKFIVRFDFKTQAMQTAADTPSTAAAGNNSKSVIMEARRAVAVAAASVHISPAQTLRRNAMIKEFRESELIGPGFRSMLGVQLQPGQRVFLTHNGRETSGDVLLHEADKDEVTVKITAIGTEEPIELKKRLEEVRLLESRRSARLADQDRDTDFARLADMGGDRRRTSHSIDVPASMTPQHNSRKRGPSYAHDDNDSFQFGNDEEMNECNAALILMKLSNSPKSPKNGEKWLGSSPGSSSASWSSGSSSPPLSDDGQITHTNSMLIMDDAASARIRTTSVSTSDEGIVMDYSEDVPRKRRANKPTFKCTWKGCDFIEHTAKKIERHIRNAHLGNKKARRSADYDGSFSESDHEEEFYYTEIEDDDDDGKIPSPPSQPTLSHRDMARPPHEDPEYQRQIVGNFKQGRAVHSHMANGQQQQQHVNNHHSNKSLNHGIHSQHLSSISQQQTQLPHNNSNAACMPTSPLAHHNYTWPSTAVVAVPSATSTPTTAQQHSPVSIMKHARCSPRPSATTAPYRPYVHHQHHHQQQQQHYSSSSSSVSSNSSCGGGSGSNNTSPIIHSNSSANNVLQQLSQQNVTVTAHHSGSSQQQQHHNQQQQLSAVTITPNYQHHNHHHHTQTQHHMRGTNQQHHQQPQQLSPTTTASNAVAGAAPHHHAHSPHTTTHPHSTQQHVVVQHAVAAARQAPNSPNRRTRGENKKCRKVYGMERRDQWCTQCKWKKACSRFGD